MTTVTRMAEGEQGADETADTVMRPDSDDTAVVADTPPTLAEALAWSAAEPTDDESKTDRRPLSAALILLLAGVCVGGVTLAAFIAGRHHQDRQTAPLTPGRPSATDPNPATTQPPSTAALSPPPAVTTGSLRADPVREQNFMLALKNAVELGAPYHLSYADVPGSHGAYMGDPTAWLPGGAVVSDGYKACAVLARYPNDHKRAADVFYSELGSPMDVDASTEQARNTYIEIVAVDLCV